MNSLWLRLRVWLLLGCLVGGQLFSLAHGAEHLRGEADAPAGDVCLVCLAAHAYDSAAPSAPQVPLADGVAPAPCVAAATPFCISSVAQPRARSPPAA